MFAAVCVKYLEIAKAQVKLSLRMNLLFSVLILALIPVVFGVNNLDYIASAFILERFVSLTAIILLAPVFFPEQDKNIAELAESKYTSMTGIYFVRLVLSAISLFLLIIGFIAVMLLMSCEFDVLKYIFGTFATAFFLGALGFAAYAVSDNIVAGYLLPLGYYTFNMFSGSEQLKNIYLFTLAKESLTEKYWLISIGAVFAAAGIIYKQIIKSVLTEQ
jgi:hypothetical protein